MTPRLSEWIAVAYLLYLIGAAGVSRLPSTPRIRTVAWSLTTILAVLLLSRYDAGAPLLVRNWAPAAYLLMMYWLPAQLVAIPHLRFEEMLVSIDRRWLPGGREVMGDRIPRLAIEALELSYLLCYPLIPLGLVCLYAGGAEADADRYWTAVLLAGALSYGFLPWLPTRPPRDTATGQPRVSLMRAINMRVVRHASVGWNTFPSGHVATAFAGALAVAAALPAAGAVLLLLAAGIAVAASVGRYHYVADIIGGLLVALVAFAISRLA
jgi:hypothetical protein